MEQINFADEPEKCVKEINRFFKKIKKFSNHKNMLMRSAITLKTQMIIANAAYFTGHWEMLFKKEETKPEIFYNENGIPIYIDMMKTTGKFQYGM